MKAFDRRKYIYGNHQTCMILSREIIFISLEVVDTHRQPLFLKLRELKRCNVIRAGSEPS